MPDGRTIAALGNRLEGRAGSRNDIWLFAADGSDATPTGGRNCLGAARPDARLRDEQRRDPGERPAARPDAGRPRRPVHAPRSTASYELWRIALADGRLERLTDGRHYISGWDAVAGPARPQPDRLPPLDADRAARRVAARRRRKAPRRLTAFNADVLAELELVEPRERHVDRRRPRHPGLAHPGRQGRAAAGRPRSTAARTRSTAGRRLGVPGPRRERHRASSTATRAAPRATARPSTTPTTATGGPARPATCSPASTPSSPTASPTPTGSALTGGSYGGYLTNWIVGHDQRFRGRDDLPVGERHG